MSDDRATRIAELEQSVQALEQDVGRLRRLLNERDAPATLRHQVRNTLGLMRAILRQSVETSTSVSDYADHIEGRFDALLRVQTSLIAGRDEGVPLSSLIADELLAYVIHEGERASIEGPDVVLGPNTAQLLGLALHELATNAIKFGPMTTASGRLAVSWSVSADAKPTLTLVWAETGMALASAPTFRGFGVEALEDMLRYQLDAESQLEFRPQGLLCTIKLPFQLTQR